MGVRGLGFRHGLRQAVWSLAVARDSCAATMELVVAFLVPVSTQSASEAMCLLDAWATPVARLPPASTGETSSSATNSSASLEANIITS